MVWKSINSKPQPTAMPTFLTSPSGDQYRTLEEKMEAIANISFPSKRGDVREICKNTQFIDEIHGRVASDDRHDLKVCPKMLK
jgi:hypothetical protein